LTLTTMALYHCSLRRFEASSCKPAPRGLSLIFHAPSWRTFTYKSRPEMMLLCQDYRLKASMEQDLL
ncbi:MAG: hypothetical protein WCO26_08200, partial [Deltaproteobacteria bacterium]